MADIFISYARADRDRIEKLAAALEAEGYSVWWDRNIVGGDDFAADIERELDAAKAVIVGWSDAGSKSKWVKDEASIGADAGKMIAVSLDGADPPIGYRQYHCIDLKNWKGSTEEGAFVDVARAAEARIKGEAPPASAFDRDGAERKPLRVLIIAGAAALAAVLAGYFLTRTGPAEIPAETTIAASEKSIAVLPFTALSADASDEYFGKGVAEEVLNALAQFPDLKVAARTSAFSFEGENVDLRAVGETLGVAHVLEGSVRRSGERLRITAQLIRVEDGFHLWSETFERELTDIFDIQDEIVAELSRVLQFRLGVGAGTGRAANQNVDPKAYEEYLRGLDLWWRREVSEEIRQQAILAFRRATILDPKFADGWSAYGISMALSGFDDTPYLDGMEQQIAEIDRAFSMALQIDPDNVRAHAGLIRSDKSPALAARHLEQAMALAPNASLVNYVAANHYFFVGDHKRAAAAYDHALTLDPLNGTIWRMRASALAATGAYFEVADDWKQHAACEVSECTQQNAYAAYYGLIGAMMAGDETEIRYWREVYERNVSTLLESPNVGLRTRAQMLLVFIGSDIGGMSDADFWRSIEAAHLKDASPYLWSSMLAQNGRMDVAIADLTDKVLGFGRAFTTAEDLYLFLPGPFEVPEEMRRHPRYHAFWARPGMAELAEMRRANGQSAGLPLPVDEDAD